MSGGRDAGSPSPGLDPPRPAPHVLHVSDGTVLHYQAWSAAKPRAALLVSHGLGEHGGRYAALARDLAPRGISVCAVDHRGHGRSDGGRAFVRRFEEYVDDLEAVRRSVAETHFAGLPLFFLGHSLGGLIALRHLAAHPAAFRGAILSAPLLGVAVKAPRWKVAAAGTLSRLLPRLPLSNEIDPAELSHDPAYVRSYREDPLVHDRITPRLFTEMMAHVGRALAEADRLPRPLLFVVPTADTVVDESAVLRFAEALPGDVTIRRYEGFRHEAHNEVDRARVIGDMAAWIDGVLARQP
ncbi:MAG TPA: alpha/beta hydrolase [Longimicrobium sp.]|nr:alpha/beta hydrolase [Longimicrobium sp.]